MAPRVWAKQVSPVHKTTEQFVFEHDTVTDWLLEPENPSVRYYALRDLMGRPPTDPAVAEAQESIQRSPLVTELLNHQMPDGSWRGARGDLWEEKGSVFSLLLLGELGAIAPKSTGRALDFLHEHYQLPTGRISYRPVDSPRRREGSSTWMWCVTAVALRAALLLGHADHPLVESAVSFFEESHEDKGGWHCSVYSSDPAKVRPPNCYMGGIKALGAFSVIPQNKRSKKLRAIMNQEVETCLDNHVCFYRVNPKGEPAIKRSWLKLAFPRYWRSDALEATDVLVSLGIRDERIQDALDLIRGKQQSDGRWLLDFSETKRAWIQLDEEGTPSKWITLRALRTLRDSKSRAPNP
jgi:hypothetical protein